MSQHHVATKPSPYCFAVSESRHAGTLQTCKDCIQQNELQTCKDGPADRLFFLFVVCRPCVPLHVIAFSGMVGCTHNSGACGVHLHVYLGSNSHQAGHDLSLSDMSLTRLYKCYGISALVMTTIVMAILPCIHVSHVIVCPNLLLWS